MSDLGSGWFPRSLATVLRDIGGIQLLVGLLMLVPALVGVVYGEWWSVLALAAGGAITALVGGFAFWVFHDAPDPKQRHALVTAGGGWLSVAVFGAMPYIFAAYWTPGSVIASHVPVGADYASSLHAFENPLHAIFESMSGFTTTGLTMTVHEPSLSHALLFYRSFTQWIGGVGVIVLALAILRRSVTTGGYSLFTSEGRETRVRPSAIGTAREIWRIYFGLTIAVAAFLAAMLFWLQPSYGIEQTVFDAVNHAMTGQATGGFSTLDASIDGYASYALELVHIPPMVLGAIAFPIYYRAIKNRNITDLTRDPQVQALFTLLAIGIPATVYLLAAGTFSVGSLPDHVTGILATIAGSTAFREGLFQYTSALTGTGWQTSIIGTWDAGAVFLMVFFAMNVGGCLGATTGGFKLIRAVVVAKGIKWEVTRSFLPENAVETIQVGDTTLGIDEINAELRRAGMMVIAYVLILIVATIGMMPVLSGGPVTASDVLFEVASAQGTVGLSSGITGPNMPVSGEALFVFLMWVGRLEIFPVLAFLRALRHGMKFR